MQPKTTLPSENLFVQSKGMLDETSESQLAMRTKVDKLKNSFVGFKVDQIFFDNFRSCRSHFLRI